MLQWAVPSRQLIEVFIFRHFSCNVTVPNHDLGIVRWAGCEIYYPTGWREFETADRDSIFTIPEFMELCGVILYPTPPEGHTVSQRRGWPPLAAPLNPDTYFIDYDGPVGSFDPDF